MSDSKTLSPGRPVSVSVSVIGSSHWEVCGHFPRPPLRTCSSCSRSTEPPSQTRPHWPCPAAHVVTSPLQLLRQLVAAHTHVYSVVTSETTVMEYRHICLCELSSSQDCSIMGSDLKIFMSCYETLTCLTHRKNNNNNRYVRGIKTRLGLTTKMFFLEIILERFMILYLKANVSRKFNCEFLHSGINKGLLNLDFNI